MIVYTLHSTHLQKRRISNQTQSKELKDGFGAQNNH